MAKLAEQVSKHLVRAEKVVPSLRSIRAIAILPRASVADTMVTQALT